MAPPSPPATPPSGCTGLFCAPETITAAIVLGVILALLALLALRTLRINVTRRARGLDPLPWWQIYRARMPARSLSGPEAPSDVAAQLELQRQKDWEKHVAFAEILRYGRPVTRAYCSAHDRYCLIADGPHPPGGVGNPRAPEDYRS